MPKQIYKLYSSGHVFICNGDGAPSYELTEDDRRKPRRFEFRFKHYVKLLSAMLHLVETRKHECIFLTLTFPLAVTEKQANIVFSKIIENFKKTYHVKNYVAIREHQEKNQKFPYNSHFHFIADYPFHSIADMQRSCVATINNHFGTDFPDNTPVLQLPKNDFGSIVNNPIHLSRYLAKYLSKSYKNARPYSARFMFTSREVSGNPINLSPEQYAELATTCHFYKKYEYFALAQVDNKLASELVATQNLRNKAEKKLLNCAEVYSKTPLSQRQINTFHHEKLKETARKKRKSKRTQTLKAEKSTETDRV